MSGKTKKDKISWCRSAPIFLKCAVVPHITTGWRHWTLSSKGLIHFKLPAESAQKVAFCRCNKFISLSQLKKGTTTSPLHTAYFGFFIQNLKMTDDRINKKREKGCILWEEGKVQDEALGERTGGMNLEYDDNILQRQAIKLTFTYFQLYWWKL